MGSAAGSEPGGSKVRINGLFDSFAVKSSELQKSKATSTHAKKGGRELNIEHQKCQKDTKMSKKCPRNGILWSKTSREKNPRHTFHCYSNVFCQKVTATIAIAMSFVKKVTEHIAIAMAAVTF